MIRKAIKLGKDFICYLYLKFHGVDFNFGRVTLIGFPIIKKEKGSSIIIEDDVTIISKTKGNIAGVNNRTILSTLDKNAEIILRRNSGLSGSKIISQKKVELGVNSGLGVNTVIYDTDFHPLDAKKRLNQKSTSEAKSVPVIIGNDVLIGANVIILKGAIIHDECVVGAGSVVVKGNLDGKSVYAGNPAVKKMVIAHE